MKAGALALLLAAAAGGCIITPVVHHTPWETAHRGEIAAADVALLVPGVTSRRDVLLLLGEPDLRGEEDRVLGYVWDQAWLFWGVFSQGGGAAGEGVRHGALMVRFDEGGILVRSEILLEDKLGSDETWYATLESWP